MGKLAQDLRREGLHCERKPDGSLVTNADRELEAVLRKDFETLAPGSSVWGEEFGYAPPLEAGWWLVDPIDGTTNFAAGSPMWGVSVGFALGSMMSLGVVVIPDLNETYTVLAGSGAWLNGHPLLPIRGGEIGEDQLVGYCEAVTKVIPRDELPGKQRCAGAFVIEGVFVAAQRLRAMIGLREKLYDMAASTLLCQELGAEVRYASGAPFMWENHLTDAKIDQPWVIAPRGSTWRTG